MNEKINKIKLVNWWGGGVEKIEDKQIFLNLFCDRIHKYDTIEIHYLYGGLPEEKKTNTLYVQYSGESFYKDTSAFDLNLIHYPQNTENVVIFPFLTYSIISHNMNIEGLLNKRFLNQDIKKKKFCVFCVTNPTCDERNNFFMKLSEYKKVDSVGMHLNNIGRLCHGNWWEKEYLDFLSQYKFMICFENKSIPNYFTEKSVNAYLAGTIPIYWGCSNLDDYINTTSILHLKKDYSEKDVDMLIQKIKILDNNDEIYIKKYETVFFKNGKIPDVINFEKIKEKVNQII